MFRFLVVLALMLPGFAYGYECSKEIDRLSYEYNVPIHCKLSSIRNLNSSVTGQQADEVLIGGIYNALNKLFITHGKDFLSNNIEEIVLLRKLSLNGQEVGGLSDGSKIYMCLDYYTNIENYRDNTYYIDLNHEFSSNILSKMSYAKKLIWRIGFDMYDHSVEYLKKCLTNRTFSRYVSETLLRNGFLANYSLTNMENDFNVYAEKLFSGDQELLKFKKEYPNVARKLSLLKEAYRDAGFKGKFPDET
jgi:hypothetical protein